MSGRLISSATPLARRVISVTFRRLTHQGRLRAGGLLQAQPCLHSSRQRLWPMGSSFIHNVPAARAISFVRIIPSLFMKLLRIPAMFGGAMIAGLVYLQYQAAQAGNYALDFFKRTGESASSTAGSLWAGLGAIADQTSTGWKKTKDDVGSSSWLRSITESLSTIGGSGGGGGGDGGPSSGGGGGRRPKESAAHGSSVAAGAASVAALGLLSDAEEDTRSDATAAKDDQMMLLTRKMIEIRSLLQTIGKSESLTLPSIVVIGSQSSGKSSVLEAIVGHEFLPKGSNMVTRRPIELTLINTPDALAEYGEFPALGLNKITDFFQIQKTLTDLNLAVPEKECVSDDPIQLRIYSPNVPDLSLIDLPGYIQVSGADQPIELKSRIAELCEKYIRSPNIILAISAADVDLANSTALRASRRVDPRGERTIGVITKMDLVDPERGASMLNDKKYALRLGYVGVVCKIPQTSGIFTRGGGNITNAITKSERAYFSAHPAEFGKSSSVEVGTTNLRAKLMRVLEQTMASSLASTSEAIHQELAEASYEFKVQYNDRQLSAESYLAENLDTFKHSFKGFSETFGRVDVRQLLKQELDQQVLNLLAQRYWNRPLDDLSPVLYEIGDLKDLPKADAETPIWHLKLDSSAASLTKLGIGRLATSVVANALQARIDQLISNSTFAVHPFARQTISSASSNILKDLSYDISDELEICIKPYKYRIEVDDQEWLKARENIAVILRQELGTCEDAYRSVEEQVGGKKKLRDVIGFIDRVRKGEIILEGDRAGGAGGYSAALLARGREATFLRDRADILKMRLIAIRSKQCGTKKNKYYCPEIFLDAVAEKLTSTADLFLDAELLSKFYYLFPRELDSRLGRNLTAADIDRFAREDPKIKRHLDLAKRKELLEHVLKETEALRQLGERERRHPGRTPMTIASATKGQSKGWTLF